MEEQINQCAWSSSQSPGRPRPVQPTYHWVALKPGATPHLLQERGFGQALVGLNPHWARGGDGLRTLSDPSPALSVLVQGSSAVTGMALQGCWARPSFQEAHAQVRL